MIVEKQPWIKIPEIMSFFQCTSYDLVKMNSIIELEADDLAWYLKEIAKGKLPRDMEYPKGVSGINRYVEEPVILIGAYYDEKIANEEDIIAHLKSIGIEVTGELDQEALQVFKDFRKREKEFNDYRTGKTDKFPEGMGSKEDFDFLLGVGNKFMKEYKDDIVKHFIKKDDKKSS